MENLLYTINPEQHSSEFMLAILNSHKEIQFVSFFGVDLGGHDTDEKIPVTAFKRDIRRFLSEGVQTDGSSVVLPGIAELNDAKVDIIPDLDVAWYVDYNFENIDDTNGLPVGTLRIPSFLIHNGEKFVGSREILKNAEKVLENTIKTLIDEDINILQTVHGAQSIKSSEDIENVYITAATELEFWVNTPQDNGDMEQLLLSQELKEQYWQRTRGVVRTALERTIKVLEKYQFEVEMGHKEVGGVLAQLGTDGNFTHIMEQLEIDWKYDHGIQAADKELIVRNIVKDVFRINGLDVSFLAKPIDGVAGSGEHTHLGVAMRLKNGDKVNLFHSQNANEYLSDIGYGAIMGLLKNYEAVNPFVSATTDALARLKPGFEAPVAIVTSLGVSPAVSSRNRTVLAGLVREPENPMSTRFELRSPSPKSNTYLVIAASIMAMIDGINRVAILKKTGLELREELSKKAGTDGFYLEKDRQYRSEKNIFTEYSEERRNLIFGKSPATVYENMEFFKHSNKKQVLCYENVFTDEIIDSYLIACLEKWQIELENRIVNTNLDRIRSYSKFRGEHALSDQDEKNWREVVDLKHYLAKDMIENKSLITRMTEFLLDGDFENASILQVEMQKDMELLHKAYIKYQKNIL